MGIKKFIQSIITIVIPIVGIVLAAWPFLFKDKRELSYEIKPILEMGIFSGDKWPGLQLLFEKNKIDNGGLMTIKLINTGSIPIYAKEFDGPLVITLDKESQFLASHLIKTIP